MVSAPCSTDRSKGPVILWNVGRDVLTPGVSAHPGCIAWNTTSSLGTRWAHSFVERDLGAFGSCVLFSAAILVLFHLEVISGEPGGVHAA